MKEISFIIPAYNVEKYIQRCIASIYAQLEDLSLFEVIVVDDGSTDRTLNMLNKLQSQHENLIVVAQTNKGPGAARNTGLEKCAGRYVWFVDADDYIAEGAAKYLLRHLNEEKLEILFFGATVVDVNGEEHVASTAQELAGTLMEGKEALHRGFDIGSVWLALWRRDFLERIRLRFLPNVYRGEDSLFCFSAVLQAKQMRVIKQRCYCYEKGIDTLTTNITPESIKRQRIGDVAIADELGKLALTFKESDSELYLLAMLHQRQIQMGLLYSLLRNKGQWDRWGINSEIIKIMKEKGLYPLQSPYGNWKRYLMVKVLNIECLVC